MQKGIIRLDNQPYIIASGAVVGKKEHEGPLGRRFAAYDETDTFDMPTWEKSESEMQRLALNRALDSSGMKIHDIDAVFAGDLINQCTSSGYGLANFDAPFFGVFGACSTIAEALILASLLVDSGKFERTAAVTSSHNCTAERQFRSPIEYGGQRAPTAQWTVTGAGCVVLSAEGKGPYITRFTPGKIVDAGIKDMGNMGAAMAPAAYDTLSAHFALTGRGPEYYDVILTGDLGRLGQEILRDLFAADGVDLGANYMDCGVLVYDIGRQDAHCGGSGCGCSASVLSGHFLRGMRDGLWRRVLFAATGALMSPTTSLQGESIPAICHAVAIEAERC